MRRMGYLIGEALRSILLNRVGMVIGVVTTAFTIASFGVFALLYLNVKHFAGSLQEDIQLIIYLKEDVSAKATGTLRRRLERDKAVATLSYISQAQALEDFHRQFPQESSLLDGMGENPLPPSFVVTLTPEFQSSEAIERLASRVTDLPGVEYIRYSQEWIDTLSILVSYVELIALVIGIILGMATVTIIANTIRLSFYARKEEIEILRLIGATGSFIAIPYIIEGGLLGAMGGFISLLLLSGGFEYFRLELEASGWFQGLDSVLAFFPLPTAGLLVLAGLVLGCASSVLSVYGLIRAHS